MKACIFIAALALVVTSAAFAQSPPAQTQKPVDLSGIWMDGEDEVELTQLGDTLLGRYVDEKDCDYRDDSGTVVAWSPHFALKLDGKKYTGKGNACYWGKENAMGVGIRDDKVELIVNPDGRRLNGTQFGFNGQQLEYFTLTRKESSYCPDTEAIEHLNAVAEQAASLSGAMATRVTRAALKRGFSDSQENLEHISGTLGDLVKLGKACSEIHDAMSDFTEFRSAIDAINSAGCDSAKLARGFDDLFQYAGKIGERFVKVPELKSWLELLASDRQFFTVVSAELNPEQRWADQFRQVDGYLPNCSQ